MAPKLDTFSVPKFNFYFLHVISLPSRLSRVQYISNEIEHLVVIGVPSIFTNFE